MPRARHAPKPSSPTSEPRASQLYRRAQNPLLRGVRRQPLTPRNSLPSAPNTSNGRVFGNVPCSGDDSNPRRLPRSPQRCSTPAFTGSADALVAKIARAVLVRWQLGPLPTEPWFPWRKAATGLPLRCQSRTVRCVLRGRPRYRGWGQLLRQAIQNVQVHNFSRSVGSVGGPGGR